MSTSVVEKAMPVIMGGENGALPIVRALAKGGITSAIIASERKDDPTFHSRYCKQKIVLESFDETSDHHNVETLVRLSHSLKSKPVLFWGSDREILFINRNRNVLSNWYRFVMADAGLTSDLVDKGRFARFADLHGLPVPETLFFSTTEEILQNRHSFPYPCTIKPVYMCYWNSEDVIKRTFGTYKHALRRIDNPEELADYVRILPNVNKGVILQRFIEGTDEELLSFHAYFNEMAEPVACFIGRKIRTNPIHFGGSAYIETIHRPDLMSLCLKICRQIGFVGVVKIDCKYDIVNGRYFILEFNTRFNLWEYLGAYAGINIPVIWYNDMVGKGYQPSFIYEEGKRWLYAAADIRALPAYLKSGEWKLTEWMMSHLSPKIYHTFAWRDPFPILFSFPRFLKRKINRWKLKHFGQKSKPAESHIPDILHQPSSLRA